MIDPDALVDPELRTVLPLLPDLSRIGERLEAVRDALSGAPPPPSDPTLSMEQVTIAGSSGHAVPGLFYRPTAGGGGARPAILNIHGGGFVAGTARREDAAMRALALDLGCAVLSVDYRLAPEHPYPAPLDDCDDALAWLRGRADGLGIDPARIAIRGVSAGGGLAAGLALRDRDRGVPPVAGLLLVYPMLDDRTGARPHAGLHVWTPELNRFGWTAYLGGRILDPPPEAAPARAIDLHGFPPTTILTGAIDLFADENLACARRLMDAGVPTGLRLYPGAYHGFNLVAGARVARRFEQDCRDALGRCFESDGGA